MTALLKTKEREEKEKSLFNTNSPNVELQLNILKEQSSSRFHNADTWVNN